MMRQTSSPNFRLTTCSRHIRRIGLQDADSVLALASGTQVQGLLDTDVWTRDEVQLERVDPWLNALMRAGPGSRGSPSTSTIR